MGGRQDNDTPKQRQLVTELLDVAVAWHKGELPLASAKDLTGDGWLRNQVSRRMTGDSEQALIWQAFITELDLSATSNCENGGYYQLQNGSRIWLDKLQVATSGGTVQSVFDPDSGEEVCVATFPRVNVSAPPPKREKGEASTSPMMAEWYE